jgi:hypothetical protein
MRFILCGLFLIFIYNVNGQRFYNKFEKFTLSPAQRSNVINMKVEALEKPELVAVSLKWNGIRKISGPSFKLQYLSYENKWSEELTFINDTHLETDGSWGTFLPLYIPENAKEIKILPSNLIEEIDVTSNIFIVPMQKSLTDKTSEMSSLANCFCDTLLFKSRDQWQAPNTSVSYRYADVTHLIVHHAASTNTSNNWANVVLSIWNFHVNTNNFSDIAYNWLIDPNGVLYEGRGGGNNVVGAHFCGKNTNTMGVCMLGNLSTVEPTEAALKTLRQILFWKSCDSKINPMTQSTHSGVNINNISGHRDGCATECPGNFMYPKLLELRSLVKASIDACSVTGINEKMEDQYVITPNPIKDVLEIPQDTKWIKIFDFNGKLYLYTSFLIENKVNVEHLLEGSYIVQILDKHGQLHSGKMIRVN